MRMTEDTRREKTKQPKTNKKKNQTYEPKPKSSQKKVFWYFFLGESSQSFDSIWADKMSRGLKKKQNVPQQKSSSKYDKRNPSKFQ